MRCQQVALISGHQESASAHHRNLGIVKNHGKFPVRQHCTQHHRTGARPFRAGQNVQATARPTRQPRRIKADVSSTTEPPRRGLSRRQVARGAAWAAPTILLASTAPAIAASTDDVTVSVTSCISTANSSTVTFTVCATGSAIGQNSTLKLTESNSSGSGTISGTLYSNYLTLSGAGPYTLTFRRQFPAGSCGTVVVSYNPLPPANLQLTLAVGTILTNPNSNTTNDSAIKTFSATGGC